MVIMTAKVPKRRILLVVLLLLAAAVILALCLGGAKHGGEKPQRTDAKGGTNEARIAFLAEYGWEVSAEPVQTQQVRVPEEPGEVFLRYNELQVSQGYDLLQYSGQELTRYVYQVTNYPDSSGTYYATLLVKDGQIVGNRTRVKVVKNKVAAPFDQAEFDILYSCGISREGSIIDAALSRGVIEKRGSWFAFGDVQIAQGQLAAIEYLKENPEITDKVIEAVKASPDRVAPALKKAA